MGSMTEDISEIRIPPADETLPKTLADLEAKLSEWKAAMLAAQEQLADQARIQAEVERQLDSRTQEQGQLKSQLDAQAEAQAAVAEQLRQQADAQAALQAELQQRADAPPRAPQASPTPAAGTALASGPPDWSSEDISKHIKLYGQYAKQASEPQPKAAPAETSEDEALLASLDLDTAKVIRVMRRMSGGRKSVRELLEQYQASQTTSRNEPTKKSWFRRGR
jgi:hypothetical protein